MKGINDLRKAGFTMPDEQIAYALLLLNLWIVDGLTLAHSIKPDPFPQHVHP